MTTGVNIISVIDILGLIQGVILGVILLAGNKKKTPSLFLGLFLLSYSLELVNSVILSFGIVGHSVKLHFLPFNFYFFSVPMFYLYAKQLITGGWNKKWWWYFVPGIVEFVIFTILFLMPGKKTLALMMREGADTVYMGYVFVSLIYSIVFAIMTNRLVNRYQERILNYFSDVGRKQLCWIKGFGRAIVILYAVAIISIFVPEWISDDYLTPAISVANIIFIYWIGITGLQQPRMQLIINDQQDKGDITEAKIRALKNNPTRKDCFEDLCKRLETQQLYKDSDLTLPELAKTMNVSRRELSQMINQFTGNNFSTFINQYRVEEAKKLLSDTDYHHLNMLGIAYEVGFSSKATFFAVFKKIAGTSPGKFKQEVDSEALRKL